ncbi:MAG: chromosome segregation protein SMC [Candidatus Lambdaproteobacteria bacterium]|nr:chromosome segregation protein SMC [Candidatus Lambdaproteobacteria bacterium]
MRLKEIKLHGFKSFCDGSEFVFRDKGITLIVGPNGCGKSNVADAIRWVLGEQSPRLLRGGSMGDVIFNGSSSRKPMGRTEVTVTFDNGDGGALEKYRDFAEIAVTRRLYRSGESEYLINKLPCRLLDVRELVMDTGAAGRSYSIVEQGRVEEFVTASPAERRLFLEEAAGIVRYKTRRIAAERRLEQTRQNLLRVQDLEGELRRQESALHDQVNKATAYIALRDEIGGRALRLAWYRLTRSRARCGELERAWSQARDDTAAEQQALARLQADLERVGLDQTRLEGLLRDQRQAVRALEQELQQGETRLAVGRQNEENGRRWVQQHQQALAEAEQAQAAAAAQRQELHGQAQALLLREAELQAAIGAATAVFAEREARRQQAEAAIKHVQERLIECHTTLVGIANQRQFLEERAADAERRRAGLADQLAAEQREHAAALARLGEATRRQGSLRLERERHEAERRGLAEALLAAGAELDQRRTRLAAQEREALAGRSRLESLREIAASHEGFGAAVRAVLDWVEAEPATRDALTILGALAELVDVPADLVEEAGAFLAPFLELIVVREGARLPELQRRLAAREIGGVRFLALDALPAPPQAPAGGGVLAERLGFVPGLEALGPALFGGVALHASAELPHPLPAGEGAGREWLGRHGAFHTDGRRIVTLGRPQAPAEGILRRRAEMADLAARLAALDTAREEAAQAAAAAATALDQLQARAREEDARMQQQALALAQLDQEIAQGRREGERLARVVAALAAERERLGQEAGGFATQREALAREHDLWQGRRTALEAELAQARGHSESARQEAAEHGQRLTEHKVAHGQALSRRENAQARLAALDTERGLLDGRHTELAAELARQQERLAATATEIAALRQLLGAQQTQLAEARRALRGHLEQHDRQEQQRQGWTEQSRQAQARLDGARTRAHEAEVALTAERLRAEQWAQEAQGDPPPQPAQPFDERAAEDELARARQRLGRMGAVNLAAPEEYEALRQRLAFLEREKGDLERASADLEESIRRMNQESRRRFKETFDQVNGKFGEIFTRIFGGGEARLVLTDSEDLLLAGVDIVAQPPGKTLQGLNLLSGGEKALTAISLIFAFFLSKPSPFCLLDEVDAPLDDVNVTRFNRLVQGMTDRTQFIIITHNKRTMEIGDVLYGVTMEEPGVSKVVSVDLAQR